MKRTIRKAFTLVEILIVVVILGILAAIVVPQFTNATQDAQAGNIKAQLDTLNNQIELYKARTNNYPTITELNTDSSNAAFAGKGWGPLIDGGYVKAPPANPFNNGTAVAAAAAAGNGWHYDATTGVLGAVNFDETTGKITPTTP